MQGARNVYIRCTSQGRGCHGDAWGDVVRGFVLKLEGGEFRLPLFTLG